MALRDIMPRYWAAVIERRRNLHCRHSGENRPATVIPAKAGIHFDFAVAGRWDRAEAGAKWIPAFAGMTVVKVRWNDGSEVSLD